jgi:hypothetical protein
MRALCARRLARSGLLPGLMRPAGAASVTEKQASPAARRRERVSLRVPNVPGPVPPGASSGSAISMKCSGSSRSAACSRHLAALSVRIGQTAASATAAAWASHGSSPVLAITAASLTACSASRRAAIITLPSRSRPCRMASVSSDRRSRDAPAMARAGITRGCPEASRPWMNVMMP